MSTATHQFTTWMRDLVLPHFLQAGVSYTSGEALSFCETLPDTASLMRSRVQTRQLYVFAHATRTGWIDAHQQVLSITDKGLAKFKNSAGAFHFSLDNNEINAYEQAFALLAYCELYQLTKDHRFRQKAELLHDWMNENLALDEGGYAVNTQRPDFLNQNPNMHLFEACLHWWHTTGDARWEEISHRLYQLFNTRIFNQQHSCLVEFFAPGWQPTLPVSCHIDPGHHHEWTWLLYEYQKISGINTEPQRGLLQKLATSQGENSNTHSVMNEITWHGERLRPESRLWCQTERIKADVVNYLSSKDTAHLSQLDKHIEEMFTLYINDEIPGQYCDEIADNGERIRQASPSSTLYHLYVACRQLDYLPQEGE